MAIFNEAYLAEATKINNRKKEYSIITKCIPEIIESTVKKFPEFNISKYFKKYKNREDDKDLFLSGDENLLGVINLISPGEFAEEYNLSSWLEYNNILNFIHQSAKSIFMKNGLTGSISEDVDKNGGWIYYESNL